MGIFDRIDIKELKEHPYFKGMNDEEVKEAFLSKLSERILTAHKLASDIISTIVDELKDTDYIDIEATGSGTGILGGWLINNKLCNSLYNVIVNFLKEKGTSESEFMNDIGTRLTGKDTLYDVLNPESDEDDMPLLILTALKALYEDFNADKIIEAAVEGNK